MPVAVSPQATAASTSVPSRPSNTALTACSPNNPFRNSLGERQKYVFIRGFQEILEEADNLFIENVPVKVKNILFCINFYSQDGRIY